MTKPKERDGITKYHVNRRVSHTNLQQLCSSDLFFSLSHWICLLSLISQIPQPSEAQVSFAIFVEGNDTKAQVALLQDCPQKVPLIPGPYTH